MRAYTVAAVAVTLGVTQKWMDNALSHHRIRGVAQARQGVTRKLTPPAITTLRIALSLVQALSLPLARALELADELMRAGGGDSEVILPRGIAIRVDISAISGETMARLAEAVEMTPTPRRGRPPRSNHHRERARPR